MTHKNGFLLNLLTFCVHRIAHLCFQTLGSDLLLGEFIKNTSLLDALFYFLETVNRNIKPQPSSAYFARFVGTLFEQYPTEVCFFIVFI